MAGEPQRMSLDGATIAGVAHRLSEVDDERARRYPGAVAGRQPVHSCYVPADVASATLPGDWGAAALAALDEHAPTPRSFTDLFGVPAELAEDVHTKVRAKLGREPVEDLRLDFEDGYGVRSEAVEDDHAVRSAGLIDGWRGVAGTPPWVGIRFKSFDTTALLERGLRTLDLVVTALAEHESGLPPGFVLTFPKVTAAEQVQALGDLLGLLESRLGLALGVLRFEIQIETTQSVMDFAGRFAIPRFIAAGGGRVSALHFGTYDYTAACGLPAAEQHLAHGACDFARNVMQVGTAGTGVRLSDGSTNVLPAGSADAVRHGWLTHFQLVTRSLAHGFYQGWDLHPAQLVTRYAATYTYYLRHAASTARRLGDYLARSGGGPGDGAVADEPATARALSGTLRRAVDCGALTDGEVAGLVGTPDWAVGR